MTILPQSSSAVDYDFPHDAVDPIYIYINKASNNYTHICPNGSPFIAYKSSDGIWNLSQGCCNSWQCPRCGQIRAKAEYWRMVNGAETLSKAGFKLYAMTLTCRGKEMALIDAERDYGVWTKRLNDALRAYAKRNKLPFHFAAVTERQKRGHPHTHAVTTFCPVDAVESHQKMRSVHFSSSWLAERVESAGFGPQYDLSVVRDARAASRYFAKYLFKTAVSEVWPKGWKRVRYSQSWPKSEDGPMSLEAFPVLAAADWRRLQYIGDTVFTADQVVYEMARHRVTNVALKVVQ